MPIQKENQIVKNFWDIPSSELLASLKTSPTGLTSDEASLRLRQYGPNSLKRESRYSVLFEFLRVFANPLVIILLIASGISFATGGNIEGIVIIFMVLMSVVLNFAQEYQARNAVKKLQKQVASLAAVLRDNVEKEIPVSELVPGDIIILNAGDLVPADSRLLDIKELNVRESALTGESLPSEKISDDLPSGKHGITEADNCVFLGTSVQTGVAKAVVVNTGSNTAFGSIVTHLIQHPSETEFDRGIRQFSLMITKVIIFLVLFVFLINILFHRPLFEAFLFALALAVGLTPELLPMITTVTLSQGARIMAKKKVIVKQLTAIENLGSMEILCSDKTGTLTEGEIVLDKHIDFTGNETDRVLNLVYLNSYFEASIKSPMDDAILKHEHPTLPSYNKVDEIPFDFARRRLSVIVERDNQCILITKGAVEDVLKVCRNVEINSEVKPLDVTNLNVATETFKRFSADGYRMLGVAIRNLDKKPVYNALDEYEMTLVGFAAFLDPPKEGVLEVINQLRDDGISVVIMTGDNQYVTQKIARDVGIPSDNIITANALDAMDDAALAYQAENGAIFAQVSPEQKNRVITALKAKNRVVGFLGDGINDAPSLHAADIGISVFNAVDVARDSANIILLEKDLRVLHDGIIQGRRSFANIMKYITMGTSSNFGNMFSMALASLFLKFLPMLPMQILFNNFLYDLSQLSIPTDYVEKSLLKRPKRWNIKFIREFMFIIGPISSIYDLLTFWVLLTYFKADEQLFHTGWFVESLMTQILVVFIIRTAGNPFKSRPSPQLIAAVLGILTVAVVVPYTKLGTLLGFVPMPLDLIVIIVIMAGTYLALVQATKYWFYKKHAII
jgi:Mg2+-importing ATPase